MQPLKITNLRHYSLRGSPFTWQKTIHDQLAADESESINSIILLLYYIAMACLISAMYT